MYGYSTPLTYATEDDILVTYGFSFMVLDLHNGVTGFLNRAQLFVFALAWSSRDLHIEPLPRILERIKW